MPRCAAQGNEQQRAGYALALRLVGLGYGLSEIAARKSAPPLDTLHGWLAENDDFRRRFDEARDARRERLVDSIVALADDDTLSARDRKLRIDARKWCVALMDKEAARTGAGNTGTWSEDIVERLNEAHRRIAESDPAPQNESPAGAAGVPYSVPDDSAQDRRGGEPRIVPAAPKADAVVATGEDNSWRDNAREWAMGIYGPAHGSGGGMSDHFAKEWWK